MKNILLSLITLVALPLVSLAGPATTTTVGFGGTAIPGGSQSATFVITKSGSYYLAGDRLMTTDVNAITVNAPDVTIDLNGCTISSNGGSTGNGIEIPNVSNVEIRNGSINDIPGDAIKATGGNGLRVIDVRVTTAGKSGLSSTTALTTVDRSDFSYCGSFGVYVFNAPTARITNTNSSFNGQTGISLAAVRGGEVSNCRVTKNKRSGIVVNDHGCLVLNNVSIQNNQGKTANEGGILLGGGSTARGNVVTLNWLVGIYVGGARCTVENNSITSTTNAAGNDYNGVSIYVDDYGSGVYLKNTISPSTNAVYLIPGQVLKDGGGNVFFD